MTRELIEEEFDEKDWVQSAANGGGGLGKAHLYRLLLLLKLSVPLPTVGAVEEFARSVVLSPSWFCHQGKIRGHLARSGDPFGCHNGGGRRGDSGDSMGRGLGHR